uniref:Uncharacterized protein n=1 Tax=uncultured bacterium fosmid pJB190D12_contig II TaxID=1478060 RepID=A0A0H3U7A9_9BACT|nr:hypothetical protein [uncultured bacterium fosmid pJB190D12_contig II]
MHRPRPAARRRHRESNGGEGHLVESPAVPRRRSVGVPRGLAESRQAARDVQGYRRRLRVGEEAPDPHRVGHRYPLRRGGFRDAGWETRKDGALVHACGSAADGDRGQRGSPRAVGPAQSVPGQARRRRGRRLRRPDPGRRRPAREPGPRRRSRQELRRDHEGRQGLQEHAAALRHDAAAVAPGR